VGVKGVMEVTGAGKREGREKREERREKGEGRRGKGIRLDSPCPVLRARSPFSVLCSLFY
jgi:hypothetical protein